MSDAAGADAPPDEVILLTKQANYVVNAANFGLPPLPGAWLRRALLGSGDESIGGRLTLTPRLLVFGAHGMNRITPTLGIPLQDISMVDDASRGPSRQLRIQARQGSFTFVVWGIPALKQRILQARDALGEPPAADDPARHARDVT